MPVTVVPADAQSLAALAEPLCALPLLRKYELTQATLLARLATALEAQDGLLVATQGQNLPPLGLAWFLPRGALATGAYLRLLLVAPGSAGQGVGTALLAAYHTACNAPPGGYFALTDQDNTAARRFYSRHGYQDVGLMPGFVRPACTELLVWRPRLTRG